MSQPTVALSLTVKCANVASALEFYAKAFGAVESFRLAGPDGAIAHAEFDIGNTHLFISGESPDWQALAMPEGTTASCLFAIHTEDCDKAYAKAIAAGATSVAEPEDHFWGTRDAVVRDPYGYRWSFGQKIEDITPEEIAERAKKLFGG
ncbi:VOC family protein [Haloferula sp.]|uniref:VOC family protein n=1 Tax=Haloferula sp. TaxID=2497595 RepID=UPI00329F5D1D